MLGRTVGHALWRELSKTSGPDSMLMLMLVLMLVLNVIQLSGFDLNLLAGG